MTSGRLAKGHPVINFQADSLFVLTIHPRYERLSQPCPAPRSHSGFVSWLREALTTGPPDERFVTFRKVMQSWEKVTMRFIILDASIIH